VNFHRQRVLIIEGAEKQQPSISRSLKNHGFQVLRAFTGLEGLMVFEEKKPDLILLDLMLRNLDGFEVCRRIRQQSIVPIIVLTDTTNEVDKLKAFELGADDHLVKPCHIPELIARIQAVLRRSRWAADPPSAATFRSGALEIDFKTQQVLRNEQHVQLTRTEWALLKELVSNAGRVQPHRRLLQRVWGEGYGEESEYLRVYIGRLRRKLEDDPMNPKYLLTEPGIGYCFSHVI
jgi:two-component system KDP operon response regulator KdpE